jgi:uncharacterized protein (TIGR03437 family)
VVAGQGQVTCQACNTSGQIFPFFFFQPMVVQVLDATGQPIANKPVNWSVVSFVGPLPTYQTQTFTDGNGVAVNNFSIASQQGSSAQPYLQSVFQASADTATVNFTETLALTDTNNGSFRFVQAAVTNPTIGVPINGTAGAPSSTPVQVHVSAYGSGGAGVQGVSVRLLNNNDPTKGASAMCATGAGADPGSVLTDASGNATCTVIFGSISGTGSFNVLVGGVDPTVSGAGYLTVTSPVGYFESGIIPISVTAGVAGQLQISSGNQQSVNAGQPTQPLVVKVTDAAGINPIPNAAVTWSVTPAGAVTFNPASSTSNSSGLASTVATLSANAVGAIAVKASLTGSLSNVSVTFTINVNVQVSGLQKVSGDAQSAPAGQAFPQPLVVQVNASNGQPAQNYPVAFSITGPGTLSTTTANSDSNGRAQVNVTAGSTPGTVTVTATTAGFNQSFTLTVIPPGPNLSGGAFLNGADFQRNSLSPCSVATIQASGLAPNLNGVAVGTAIVGPLPYTLAGDSLTVGGSQAPIYSVSHLGNVEQLSFQVPCDVTPGSSVPVTVNVSGGTNTVNIAILPGSPGIFQTTMSDNVNRAVLVRPDGTFVSLTNPARIGEQIRLYATGLGPVIPSVGTNATAVPGVDSHPTAQVIVGVNNEGTSGVSARLLPGLIGVFEVTFLVPSDAPVGNDVVLSLAVNVPGDSATRFSAGSKIPIQH